MPIVWLTSLAGSGKTTLVAGYIQERKVPCIWYQCDAGDADLATFFYYMALAAQEAGSRRSSPLPLLTPEYQFGLSIFTRRYFEDLYAGLLTGRGVDNGSGDIGNPPRGPEQEENPWIVFDNYQDIPATALFHEMLVQGLEVLPPGITIAILSRDEPPPSFTRLLANNRMARIGWDEMRFTLEETEEAINAGPRRGMSRRTIDDFHAWTDGWIAGIVLLLGRGNLRGVADELVGNFATPEIFAYFAAEVFDGSDKGLQQFLLRTAFLPSVRVPQAEHLSGSDQAGAMLATLHYHNYFTERLADNVPEYRYHPLFREFLMARARAEMTAPERAQLLARTAGVLIESGQLGEAAALLAELHDWENLGVLLAEHAASFVIEGRNTTLESFLRRLPAENLAATPALLYWLGVCRMPFDTAEGRAILEQAFHSFAAAGDTPHALTAWAAAVDSIITEHNDYTQLDPWVAWLDNLGDIPDNCLQAMATETVREVVASMLFALTFRQPWHPGIGQWRERAEALLLKDTDLAGAMFVGARLLLHHTFFGEIHRAELFLQNIQPPDTAKIAIRPLALIQWKVINAIYAALGTGSLADCLTAINRGLALSRHHGIHVFEPMFLYYGAIAAALAGDIAGSDRFLEEMVTLRIKFNEMSLAYYISALAWRDLLTGDARAAAERIRTILPVTELMGHVVNTLANHIGLAHALFEQGERAEAYSHLELVRAKAGAGGHWFEHAVLVSEAYFAFLDGREEEGLARAALAFKLGRETGVAVFVYWRPQVAALLCTKALNAGLETDYVRQLIRRLRLRPDPSCPNPADWPWPLRIQTLGSFRIYRDDTLLEFARKTPRKPLDLLKALISFGARDVPLEKIIDALWPDADGDLALKSFETTLSRLRRLLGEDNCLRSSGRQLSLDPESCWVDSIALEALLGRSGALPAAELPRLCREAVGLYAGRFLPADGDCPWVVSRGELLKNRLLSVIGAAGRRHEEQGEWSAAADCYRQGLDLDDLAEEFCRRLMTCYRELDQRAEGVKLYHRFQQHLERRLGIAPSLQSQAVFTSLMRDAGDCAEK